jgi:hypothetical protein
MQDDIQYTDRYCAFLDILGFRQLVESLSKDPQNIKNLRALLQKVHGGGKSKKLVRAQSISDAVALSTEPNMEGLGELMQILMALSIDLLCEGFLFEEQLLKGLSTTTSGWYLERH